MSRIGLLFRLPAALSAAALLGLALMLLADVVSRAFGAPLLGAQDLAEAGLIVVTFGALAALDWEGAHIRVDLLATKLPAWLLGAAEVIYGLLACGFWLGLAWCLIDASGLSRLLGLASNILAIPRAPLQLLAAGFAALAALAAVLRLIFRGAAP